MELPPDPRGQVDANAALVGCAGLPARNGDLLPQWKVDGRSPLWCVAVACVDDGPRACVHTGVVGFAEVRVRYMVMAGGVDQKAGERTPYV